MLLKKRKRHKNLQKMNNKMENKQYTFFWRSKSPFSQWHASGFYVDNIYYKTAEHYMMWSKAMLFGDKDKAAEVLLCEEPREAKQKGREVSGFDKKVWDANCKKFVYDGNYAKFKQNANNHHALMSTGDTLLVEAAPNDAIWGIGIDEATAKKMSPDKWPGTNWLGEVLTELRENLKKELLASDDVVVECPQCKNKFWTFYTDMEGAVAMHFCSDECQEEFHKK